jgi:hypothetical protein
MRERESSGKGGEGRVQGRRVRESRGKGGGGRIERMEGG